MKKIFSISLALLAMAFVGCSDWTEQEALNYEPGGLTNSEHGEAYYANLRAYKATKHPIAFGWYSDWTGVGTQTTSQLMGMPDSMDIVSMWGNWHSLSPEKKADLEKVQRIKGTRVMMCFIVDNCGAQTTPPEVSNSQEIDVDGDGNPETVWVANGEYYYSRDEAVKAFWGWVDGDDVAIEAAIRKYANSLLDTIEKYHWDGFDLDLEPHYGHYGNLASYPDRLSIFLDEMSKELGPKSGTRKLLCCDGEPAWLNGEDGLLLNYFILQAYGDYSDSSIDGRLEDLLETYKDVLTPEQIVGMTVLTSNFESYASTGGGSYYTRDGLYTNQLSGYAMYRYPGIDSQIGGIGAYRIGFDTNYQYLRKAIGILNPVIK